MKYKLATTRTIYTVICVSALCAVSYCHFNNKKTTRYRIFNIGTLSAKYKDPDNPLLPNNSGHGLNERGQITGTSNRGWGPEGACFYGILWSGNQRGGGHLRNVGTPVDKRGEDCKSLSIAQDINNKGEVVGVWWAEDSDFDLSRGFLWKRGKMQNLGHSNQLFTYAHAINDKSQVVGFCHPKRKKCHAFLWQKGQLTKLSFPVKEDQSWARDINNKSQIVGEIVMANQKGSQAFLWKQGHLQVIGPTIPKAHIQAIAINDKGQVVGDTIGSSQRGVWVWSQGKATPLKSLGGTADFVTDINNRSQIVGSSNFRATLWEKGQVYDLNALIPSDSGWDLNQAQGINDKGQIIVDAQFQGKNRVLLLTPDNK